MDVTIRAIEDSEFPAYSRCVETAFGNQPTDEEVNDWHAVAEIERTLAAFEDERIVGTAGAYSFELSLPGGTNVPAAGVTAVGVLPSHHRRGLLRALMERQLDDVAALREPVAILSASESVIYGRFGYGPATIVVDLAIDTKYGGFAEPLTDRGHIELVQPSELRSRLPAIHDQARRGQPGDVKRSESWWDLTERDPDWMHPGKAKRFWAIHSGEDGQSDGYLSYRVERSFSDDLADSAVQVIDLVGVDPLAEAAMWRYVLDLDLVTRVTAEARPIDEAVRWRLADARRLRTTAMHDDIWVRLLDVPSALSARRYSLDTELVLEVHDSFRPGTTGRYLLRAGLDGAECSLTTRTADISVGIAELGAAYLGQPRFSAFAGAGRAIEHTPGALRRADVAFASFPAPFCRSGF